MSGSRDGGAVPWEGIAVGLGTPVIVWAPARSASPAIGGQADLEVLPPDGFEIACFPVKAHRASAGWTRAVAILPE